METARKNPDPRTPSGAVGTDAARSSLFILPDHRRSTPGVAAIAGATGLSEYDARQRCLSGRPAVLLRSSNEAELEAGRSALLALGHSAVVLHERDVRDEGYPLSIRSVSISGDHIAFLDLEERQVLSLAVADTMLLIISNPALRGESPVSLGRAAHTPGTVELHEESDRKLAHLLVPPLDQVVLDVVWDTAPRIRIRAGRFNFHTLGEHAAAGIAVNMKTLLALLTARSRRPLLDVGGGTLQPPHPGHLAPQGVDGHDYDRPGDERDRTHEIYCRTLVALWRRGLFDGVTSEPLPRGHTTFLTRTAPLEAPADANDPLARGNAPMSFPIPGAGAAPPRPSWLDDLRSWGSPGIVLPLFGISVGGILLAGRSPVAVPGAALSAGFLALSHGLTLFSRRRRIENVPTSKIRSVAAGLCEIAGTAEPLTPLYTPFSRMPCVYYEYRITPRRSGEGQKGGPDGSMNLLTRTLGGNGGSSDSASRSGSSGHIPFLVRDETGTVVVDPRGALVDVSRDQVLYNPPFEGGLIAPGVPVVVHEKYIPAGYPVYVMGELRPTGSPALDPSSETALRERLKSEGRADRPVVMRPRNNDFFYISERSEKAIVRSMAFRSEAAFVAGIVLIATGTLLLIDALGGFR
jgi:hypothetical protein